MTKCVFFFPFGYLKVIFISVDKYAIGCIWEEQKSQTTFLSLLVFRTRWQESLGV